MKKIFITWGIVLAVFANMVCSFAWFTDYDSRTLQFKTGIFAKPYLMAGEDFNEKTSPVKSQVTSVEFMKSIPDLSAYETDKTKFDVSKEQDKSVMAWVDGTAMYIGGRGGIIADASCNYLFSNYEKVTKIQFKGLLDTSETTSARGMLLSCMALQEVDLNTLVTDNIRDFQLMLANCISIQSVDISAWNVSNAENMYGMLMDCRSIYDLKLGVKHAEKVKTFENMLRNCGVYMNVDFSKFYTRDATNYNGMFLNTRIYELDLSGFQMTENATLSQMFGYTNVLSTVYASSNWSEIVKVPSIPFWRCGLTTSSGVEQEGIDMANYDTGYFTYKAYQP